MREVVARLGEMRPITVEPVPAAEQASWDAAMAKLDGEPVILGALLFAAPARHVAVREACAPGPWL